MTATTKNRASRAKVPNPFAVDFNALRESAIFSLRFEADNLQDIKTALSQLFYANLLKSGVDVDTDTLTVEVVFSVYSPVGDGIGALSVTVTADWPKLGNKSYVGFRELVDGLPLVAYSGTNNGRPLGQQVGPVHFGIVPNKPDFQLLMFLTALAQERALSTALSEMQASLQTAGVARALYGTGPDFKALDVEKSLQEEIEEIEATLVDKREELTRCTADADKVRKKLREIEVPAVAALKKQVNTLRDKLGKKPL